MPRFVRRSLLIQLVSVYLIFVGVVLIAGMNVNAVVEQHLQADVQASDLALAQNIALDTSAKLTSAETSLITLGALALRAGTSTGMVSAFQAFIAARGDLDNIYWVDPVGVIRISIASPTAAPDLVGVGAQFSPPGVIQRALSATVPVFEVGIAAETTFNAGVIIAYPVHDRGGELVGIIATSLSLSGLSASLTSVVQAQALQGRHLLINVIDDRGALIATPQRDHLLEMALNKLPGADQALQGHPATRLAPGPQGEDWLFSSVPIEDTGWAVVVQRPASEALAVVAKLHLWLLLAALIFAFGGLVFWWMLLRRVIQPLHTLASEHQTLPPPAQASQTRTSGLAERNDEVGGLARSLERLERDVLTQLGELRTLLETSTAVVGSLDPRAVVGTIIREAGRLVDVQAAAVLVPNEHGVLRVLVSDGHTERYDQALSLAPENVASAAVLALRDGQPVQKLLDPEQSQPSLSSKEGFRAVLAIPIISRHAGGVVLLVHRIEPQPFSANEVDLLLTFANYATLAWEHAVLYERSDERLREVAHENERLYRESSAERQRLAAIMGSLRDGLVLTGIDGAMLYANPGTSALLGMTRDELEGQHINILYAALRASAVDPAGCARALTRLTAGTAIEEIIEIRRERERRAIHLRLFDVSDDTGQAIGRGMLLRDITREREMDEFKTTLLAAVGHELRTPLAAIKGHASTLLQDDVSWSTEDQRHFLRTISGEADRLARLVSNLLDLSRQEAGLLLLTRTPTQLRELIEWAADRIPQPGVALSTRIPDDLPTLDVDRARIEVVLDNLLANAITYGEGEVTITAERREAAVIVSISDNGPGLAPDELPHAFERFYRARRGRQQHSGGTGLGLAICRAFVEAHGGRIWVERQSTWTIFSFSLPLVAPTANPLAAAPGELALPVGTPSKERSDA